ncbi:hypothetical protein K466DRAFT_75133 [Polyporus arcularius HHB13444]|uniref:Uncharacterized protein n=1 Tax=Polyporus arcularius HHB13444 TaxID=1314778 RepID=A0A5C3NLY1_9APHY|nr:hypothetical protein K466DRAFT_75133 [Polyporus arcularius HHB13444]
MASGWRALARNHNWPQALRLCSGPHSTYTRPHTMLDPIKTSPAMGPSHHDSPQIRFAHPDHPSPLPDGRCLRPARCRELLHCSPACSSETTGLSRLRPLRFYRAAAPWQV